MDVVRHNNKGIDLRIDEMLGDCFPCGLYNRACGGKLRRVANHLAEDVCFKVSADRYKVVAFLRIIVILQAKILSEALFHSEMIKQNGS